MGQSGPLVLYRGVKILYSFIHWHTYTHTYIQTPLALNMLMWGLPRLAPTSLVSRPSLPFFGHLQYAELEGKGLGFLTTWSTVQASHFITPSTCMHSHVWKVYQSSLMYLPERWDKHQRRTASSLQNISELGGITLKNCQMVCVKYPQW